MSGLIALLDDVAGIAKVAAASVDNVMSQTAKAGAKTAVQWITKTTMDGISWFGLGLILIPVATKAIIPLWGMLRGK